MKWRALLLALALLVCVDRARATNITVTITGTISSGTDTTNMWGYGVNGSLAGAAFTATYTFNDALGTNSPTGSPSYIWTPTGSTTSPGTATVTIGLFTHSFGTRDDDNGSEAMIYTATPPSVGGYAKYTTDDNITNLEMGITPTAYGLVGNWETSIPSGTAVNAWSNNYFTYSDITNNQSSIAYLTPTSIQVTGVPYGCDVPVSETTVFDTWGPSGYVTKALYIQQLQDANSANNTPSNTGFNGGNVIEYSPTIGTDACWQGAQSLGMTPPGRPIVTVSSEGANPDPIGSFSQWTDIIGHIPSTVAWYQRNLPSTAFPRAANWTQAMQYQCPAGGAFINYGGANTGGLNAISYTILDTDSPTDVFVIRSGVVSGPR